MEISTSYEAGRLTIYLSGELDHHEARRAPEAVVNVAREKKAKLEALIENLKISLEQLG